MEDGRRHSPALPKNCEPILGVLRDALSENAHVLEIGSGPGEHAAWFVERLPGVRWTPSDRPGRLDSARAWVEHVGDARLSAPLELDLEQPWEGVEGFDALVAINVLHASSVDPALLFERAAGALVTGGVVFVYGPYRYADRPLEPSNASFDSRLRAIDLAFGIRLFEDVDAAARARGFTLVEDRALPSNNRGIWWRLEG